MKTLCSAALCVTVCLFAAAACGQDEFEIWPNGAPGAPADGGEIRVRIAEGGDHVLSNIHKPTLTPYLPAEGRATGAAMIVAPGGGHRELWSDHEGHDVARWLADHGVAGFVLKYRLANEEGSPYSVEEHAVADGHRAVRVVRSRAEEWGIDPNRVGIMGFSAGGEVAFLTAQLDAPLDEVGDAATEQDATPSFQALVYPGRSHKLKPTSEAPPVFIVAGYGDRPDISRGMAEAYLLFKDAGVPAELHLYSQAGHGFGLRERNRGAVSKWPMRMLEWMDDLGLLEAQSGEPSR